MGRGTKGRRNRGKENSSGLNAQILIYLGSAYTTASSTGIRQYLHSQGLHRSQSWSPLQFSCLFYSGFLQWGRDLLFFTIFFTASYCMRIVSEYQSSTNFTRFCTARPPIFAGLSTSLYLLLHKPVL